MKILVTGGGGFLGKALCRGLVERGILPATPAPRCTHSLLAMLEKMNIAKENP